MEILVEAITVVVPTAVLDPSYPGGRAAFERDAPNRTHCSDGYLAGVRFMVPADVQAFIDQLSELGLVFHDGQVFVEFAVVDQLDGPTAPSDWLFAGRSADGFSVAWLKGTHAMPMAHPAGWTPRQSARFQFVSSQEKHERYLHLCRQGSLDVVLDFQ